MIHDVIGKIHKHQVHTLQESESLLQKGLSKYVPTFARTILQQLGGYDFSKMVNFKNPVFDKSKKYVSFKFMKGKGGINFVKITLTSLDLYDIEFGVVRGVKYTKKKEFDRIYADQLPEIFREVTGLETRMPTVINKATGKSIGGSSVKKQSNIEDAGSERITFRSNVFAKKEDFREEMLSIYNNMKSVMYDNLGDKIKDPKIFHHPKFKDAVSKADRQRKVLERKYASFIKKTIKKHPEFSKLDKIIVPTKGDSLPGEWVMGQSFLNNPREWFGGRDVPNHGPLFYFDEVEDVKETLRKGIKAPYVAITHSTLGGKERASIAIKLSLDNELDWPNGIFHNSRYAIFFIWNEGVLELSTYGRRMKNLRKGKVKSIDAAVKKLNKYIESNTPKKGQEPPRSTQELMDWLNTGKRDKDIVKLFKEYAHTDIKRLANNFKKKFDAAFDRSWKGRAESKYANPEETRQRFLQDIRATTGYYNTSAPFEHEAWIPPSKVFIYMVDIDKTVRKKFITGDGRKAFFKWMARQGMIDYKEGTNKGYALRKKGFKMPKK